MFATRMRTVGTALLVFVLAMWLALPATGSATSGTMTVTQNTVLTEDHTGEIGIAADNVTLDCANDLVTDTGNGIVIQINGHSGVTVKECRITGGNYGLFVTNSTGPNTLLNSTSFSNANIGISEGGVGERGLRLDRARGDHDDALSSRGFDGL